MARERISAIEGAARIVLYWLVALAFGGAGILMLRVDWMGSVFLLIGITLAVVAARATLSRLKYGAVVLDLEVPVVPGGTLQATLVTPGRIAGVSSIMANLRCKRMEFIGAGDNSDLRETIIWSTTAEFPLLDRGGASAAEIRLVLPEGALLSGGARPIVWELQVNGNSEGVDLARVFYIEVVARPTVGKGLCP